MKLLYKSLHILVYAIAVCVCTLTIALAYLCDKIGDAEEWLKVKGA